LLILLLAVARREASSPLSPTDAIDCIGTGTDGTELVLPRSPTAEQ
jgi:hypothetical protein